MMAEIPGLTKRLGISRLSRKGREKVRALTERRDILVYGLSHPGR